MPKIKSWRDRRVRKTSPIEAPESVLRKGMERSGGVFTEVGCGIVPFVGEGEKRSELSTRTG